MQKVTKTAAFHFLLNESRNSAQSYYKFRTFVPTWGYDFRYCLTIPPFGLSPPVSESYLYIYARLPEARTTPCGKWIEVMDTPQVKRIELFALPFLLGTLIVSLMPAAFRCVAWLSSTTFVLCALLLFRILLIIGTQGPDRVGLAKMLTCSALCAAVCVFRAEATAISGATGFSDILSDSEGSISIFSTTCLWFKGKIDALSLGDKENNALIKALLTGDRSGLSPQTVQAFRDSGASHILALSGLHLGIIYAAVTNVFCIFGNSPAARKIRSVLTIAACWGYCLMVGAAPSISRAFLFILLRETARICGRSASLRDILWSSFVIHVCLDATAVRSLSFQLSYLAIAGIAYIYPAFSRMWLTDSPKHDPFRWVWNSVCLSISCQLTTGPLAYLRFGTFPRYFIMTNLLSLPLTGVLIPAALLTTLLDAAKLCPQFLLQATAHLTAALRQILEIIASL